MTSNPLFNYTIPCTCGDTEIFEQLVRSGKFRGFLDKYSSLDRVRDYFFEVHNPYEHGRGNLSHLVLPYEIVSINGDVCAKLATPFFEVPRTFKQRVFSNKILKQTKKITGLRNVLDDMTEGGIIITHARIIVDYAQSKEELVKYNPLYKK